MTCRWDDDEDDPHHRDHSQNPKKVRHKVDDSGIPGDLDHPGVEDRIERWRHVGPQT